MSFPTSVAEIDASRARHCVIPIAGTHGDDGRPTGLWWQSGSPFMRMLARQGICHLNEERPFTWSTDLNGHRFWRRWFGRKDSHRDWIAGGYALSYYCWPARADTDDYIELSDRNVIAHSHGGQVVFYACAFAGLRINRLITVGTPIRADMKAIIEKARPNIGQWLHVRDERDATAIWGGIGDGQLRRSTRTGHEDWCDIVPGIGHSGVLHDESLFFRTWVMRGWVEFLKTGW